MDSSTFEKAEKELLKAMRHNMNGVVVSTVKKMTSQTIPSFGVSIPALKKIATRYEGDHPLALYLFDKNIRELKLTAIFIDAPEQVTASQMEKWGEGFKTLEIAENAASSLFWKSPDAFAIACKWLQSDDIILLKAALLIAGRIVTNENSSYTGTLLNLITPLLRYDNDIISGGIIFALERIARTDKMFRDKIVSLLKQEDIAGYPTAKEVRETVFWDSETY